MTAEKQSVDAISAQLVELRRDLGRVAVEHGLDSKELKDVQARIATLTAKLKEAEAAKENDVPPPLKPASALDALERIGRSAKPKRQQQQTQPELPLFDPAKLDGMALDADVGDPMEHDPIYQADKSLKHLREFHRQLSEQLVAVNRELTRQADDAAPALRDEAEALRSKQAEVEAEIEAVTKELKALLQAEKQRKATELIEADEAGKGGLVKVRHPNRDFFLADLFDYAMKDDGASMEAPIFTLSTKPDLSIWTWTSKDGNKSIKVAPSVLGRATQHDKDVLIYVVSQLTEALNRGREDAKHRVVRFTVYDFLVTTNRGVGGDDYQRLQEAFERLRGTSITTDIKTGGQRVKEGFGIIDRWKIIEKAPDDERMIAVEVTLSEWLYNAVSAFEVLTIHPDYFRLRKPLARRLYELARKHCGHQTSWVIGLELLRDKSGSKSNIKEFRRMVRAIEADDSLPEYRLVVGSNDKVTFYVRDGARLIRGITKRVSGA
ncbi:TPA: replication initiator protein A [Pseudomonas aeruginosa]|uniref:replication initiator protein A n=1 Tax=Pseudomonas aeruginosa TaxID=287 RepID=UPI000A6E0BC5|nr:replication initiator protein A [Pseudomonas aeruginosa]MCE1161579.1 replication initiator protein A [Thiomonas sp.]